MVLVLEHDPVVRRLLDLQLRHLGHEPVCDLDQLRAADAIDGVVVEPARRDELLLAQVLREHDPLLSGARGA